VRWRRPRRWGILRQPMCDARWENIALYFLLVKERR
jgi:hypothetical protein